MGFDGTGDEEAPAASARKRSLRSATREADGNGGAEISEREVALACLEKNKNTNEKGELASSSPTRRRGLQSATRQTEDGEIDEDGDEEMVLVEGREMEDYVDTVAEAEEGEEREREEIESQGYDSDVEEVLFEGFAEAFVQRA